jgi:hypothetical protein
MDTRLALSDRVPFMRRLVRKQSGTLGLCRNGRVFRAVSHPAWPIAFLAASPMFPLEPRFLAKKMPGVLLQCTVSNPPKAHFPPRF